MRNIAAMFLWGHGEVRAMQGYINKMGGKGSYLQGYTIYTTLEPCAQCSGMMVLTQLYRTVYGQKDPSYGKAIERLNLDSSKISGVYKPYPDRPNYNRVISSKSQDKYGYELDESYKNSGIKSITKFLLSNEAEKIYQAATQSFLNYEVKHPSNRSKYAQAVKFFNEQVTDHYQPLPAMTVPKMVKSDSKDSLTSLKGYAFQVNNGKVYTAKEFHDFIDNEIRSRLSRTSKSRFDVKILYAKTDGVTKELIIEMEPHALYIEKIAGVELSDNVSKYTDDNIMLSRDAFAHQLNRSYDFDSLSLKEKQDVLKTFAFVIAEAARFEDIEKAVSNIFLEDCKFNWKDYMLLVRRWKTMSIFANSRGIPGTAPTIGGWKAFLIAPISEEVVKKYDQAAKNGWLFIRYNYDKQVKDRPVNIPDEEICGMCKVSDN